MDELTQEQIDKQELDAIAKKYNVEKVFKIIVPFGEEGSIIEAYFKKPDRNIISASMSIEKRNPLKAKDMILRSCFLEGDKRIYEYDDAFLSACTVVDDFVSIKRAELKKN